MHSIAVWMNKVLHGVAHSKSRQDEKMREVFRPSSAPGTSSKGNCLEGAKLELFRERIVAWVDSVPLS